MLEVKTIQVDDIQCQLTPIPILKVARLDKKVISILAPILGTVKNLDDDINMGQVVNAVMEALSNFSNEEYENFILDLCSTVVCVMPGKPPTELTRENIDKIFNGRLKSLYKLMYEVMKYNKFTPFDLMAGGQLNQIMSMFQEGPEIEKKSGEVLETSES